MRVAALQADYLPYPSSDGLHLVAERLEECERRGVELLVCPEAVIGELANESDGDAPDLVAIPTPDVHDTLRPVAHPAMTVVVGFTERTPSGTLHNAAAVLIEGRLAGIYRKTYPGVRTAYEAGVDLPVFHHRGMSFGVLICDDAHYIEPARILASRGARLLVIPVHGGHRPAKEQAWRARGTNVLIARAVENGVHIVAADVAGHQGERICHGTTAVINDQGTVIATGSPLRPGLVVAELDLEDGRPHGGIDGRLDGTANPAVTQAFLDLYTEDQP